MAAEKKVEVYSRDYLRVGPPRLPPGRLGKRVRLSTNSFSVQWLAPALTAYSVAFDPEIPPEDQSARELALGSMKQQISEVFGPWSFDGLRLIATKRPDRDTVSIASADGKKKAVFAFGQEIDANAPWAVSIVNQFFKRQLRDFGLFRMQRNFFELEYERVLLEGRREPSLVRLYRGYATSIEPTLLGLQLQVDVVHRVVKDQTVRAILDKFEGDAYKGYGHGSDRAYAVIERNVKQSLVGRTMVLDYNHWTWRIDGVDWDMTADSEFVLKDGSKTSFRKYVQSRYNIKIGKAQPGLLFHVSKRKEIMYFLPELCRLTGISPEEKEDFKFMKSLADKTKLPVVDRFNQIRHLPSAINAKEKGKPNNNEPAPLAFSSEPTVIDGRVLGPFQIVFRDGQERAVMVSDKEVNFPQRVKDLVVTNAQLRRWLVFSDMKHKKETEELLSNFPKFVPKNAKLSNPEVLYFEPRVDARPNGGMYSRQFVTALERALREAQTKKQPFEFVIFVLDDRQEGVYEAVKEFCLSSKDLAIPNQVILTKNLNNPKRLGPVLSNMMRQVFTKAGAIPWRVRISLPEGTKASIADTMVIGLDVCHFRAANRSTVGVCASMDQHFSYYNSFVVHQEMSQEILLKAKEVMLEVLRQYGIRSKGGVAANPMVLPQQILVFRDGVSNSQMKKVLATEVEGYKLAFNTITEQKYIGGPYNPKLTVLIVQKRVSLRMVPQGMQTACSPGTVVDTGIVSSEFNDFYLIPCAPHPNVGTATPTRYVTLIDEIGFASDDIQQLAHQFSSYYYNWTGGIRVPAPCMYAHKIAYLFGKTITTAVQPHTKLQGLPFYL